MRLERMLRPRSIVAIGGLQAGRVVEQCQRMGFAGDIWPVHPHKQQIQGLPAYQSLADLPDAPDAAFIGVNRHLTIEIVRQLRALGCGGAVCFAAGFLEADATGGELQSELIAAAGDMPVLGPNCYGYINYADGALLWPDQQGGKRLGQGQSGVAIIAQSSNIAINFTMQKRGLPLSYVLTVGNQALVGISELGLNLLDDPRVTALGIYIEAFDSTRAFEVLAQKARAMHKPIVVYKVGKSVQARRAALSHTASLAGDQRCSSAFLERNGFGRADSIPVFLETLKLLHLHGPLGGYRISSMSCSGGEAGIIADSATSRKVYFPELDAAQIEPLQQVLGPLVSVANPLDYHTYSWGNREVMQATYSAMTALGFDMNFLILDFPHPTRCDDDEWHIAVDAFDHALQQNQAKGAFVVSMAENISEDYTENYNQRGIVSFYGIDEALRATEIAADIGTAWRRQPPAPILQLDPAKAAHRILDEASAKQTLREFDVPIPAGARIDSVEAASALARQLGYPVVLKTLGLAHKTEHNALRLNLGSDAEVRQAARELFTQNGALYLESMQNSIVEMIVGVTRDAQFGLVLTIGSGGILVELLADTAVLLMPASPSEIENAISSLKLAPLMAGYRGRPAADIEAAIACILAIQQYAISRSDSLIELDVNPLLIGAQGCGVYAADALIVLEE